MNKFVLTICNNEYSTLSLNDLEIHKYICFKYKYQPIHK